MRAAATAGRSRIAAAALVDTLTLYAKERRKVVRLLGEVDAAGE